MSGEGTGHETQAWWTDVDPLVAPCSVCGATAYTVENNEPRCPEHLEPLGSEA